MGRGLRYGFPEACPRLRRLDNEIEQTEADLYARLFFGKKPLRAKIDGLSAQRQKMVQECQSDECPGVKRFFDTLPDGRKYFIPEMCGVDFINTQIARVQVAAEQIVTQSDINGSSGE